MPSRTTAAVASALLLLPAGVAGEAVELTDTNFDKLVFKSGKSAFIKFLAPWCGHCKSMKPDWDALGEKYEDSKKVLIGDVDCTGSGKKTCERFGVEGYPTLKYFNPPDTEGEAYDGGRSLKELKKFVKKLGPGCSVQTWDKCSEKQKTELQPYLDMSVEELEALRQSSQDKIDTAQSAHDVLMKTLQEQYETSEKDLKALKEAETPALKLIKMALKGKEAPAEGGTAAKDEV